MALYKQFGGKTGEPSSIWSKRPAQACLFSIGAVFNPTDGKPSATALAWNEVCSKVSSLNR